MTSPVAGIAARVLSPGGACILVTAPGSSVPEELSEAIGAGRVFAHPPWAGVAAADELHVELGDRDIDLAAPRASLWPGGRSPMLRRRRCIDSLYRDGKRIGLIVLAEPCDAAAILHGAAETLGAMQPAIIVDRREVVVAGRSGWLGRIGTLLPAYEWSEPSPGIHCGRAHGGPIMHRLEPWRPAPILFDAALVCGGLHPPEFDARRGGRWSGSGYATWFVLPRPAPGRWGLRLDIADWGNVDADIPAALDGAPFGPCTRTVHAALFGPAEVPAGGETVRVRLFLPRAATDLVRWPRRIGLRIRQATWQPGA